MNEKPSRHADSTTESMKPLQPAKPVWGAKAVGVASAVLALLAGRMGADAAEIRAEDAMRAAEGWLRQNDRPMGMSIAAGTADGVKTVCGDDGRALFHVVHMAGGGSVVMSADDGIRPVVAFTEADEVDESGPHPFLAVLKADMAMRLEAVAAARGGERTTKTFAAKSKSQSRKRGAEKPAADSDPCIAANENAWDNLVELGRSAAGKPAKPKAAHAKPSDVRVEPMLESKNIAWGQGSRGGGYNKYTPNNYPCGCVATAFGQIFAYHRHPSTSVAQKEYRCFVDGVATTRKMQGGKYGWTSDQDKGKVVSDIGIAGQTAYTADFSGSADILVVPTLPDVFHYKFARSVDFGEVNTNIGAAENPRNAILASLDAELPVVVGLDGHEVVVDGYGFDANQDTVYCHVNWGWYGDKNTWYDLMGEEHVFTGTTSDGKPKPVRYSLINGAAYNIDPKKTGDILSGRVTGKDGKPLKGVKVTMKLGGKTYSAQGKTNDKGIYVIRRPSGVSATEATVTATHQGASLSQTVAFREGTSVVNPHWELDPATGKWTIFRDASGGGEVGNVWGVDFQFGKQDVVLVIDSTGSMSSAIGSAKASAVGIVNKVLGGVSGGAETDNRIAVVEYRDKGDSYVYRANTTFTADAAAAKAGINRISADGGGDEPEALYATLHAIADGAAGAWRASERHIIVMTDASAHDPDPVTGDTKASIAKILGGIGASVERRAGSKAVGTADGAHLHLVYLGSAASTANTYRDLAEATEGTCQVGVNPAAAAEAIEAALAAAAESVYGDFYVDAATGDDANGGRSWATAKASIQGAIDEAEDGDLIVVNDGTYAPIRTVDYWKYPEGKQVEIVSVNGAEHTAIDAGPTSSDRCAYLGSRDRFTGEAAGAQAVLDGFTLRGARQVSSNSSVVGAGAYGGVLRNCVVTDNQTKAAGGGVAFATCESCTIAGNKSVGWNAGGAYASVLTDCVVENNEAGTRGGGTFGGRLVRCHIRDNKAGEYGGGSLGGDAEDCLYEGNEAGLGGGGTAGSTLSRCTVANNRTGGKGGGTRTGVLHGSIVWGNQAEEGDDNCHNCQGAYNDTLPRLAGRGNIAKDPKFLDAAAGDYRLAAGSPCIDAGFGPTDLERKDIAGEPRWQGARIDMGTYESAQDSSPEFAVVDLWVDAANGSDSRAGTSRGKALKSIGAAVEKAVDGATIHVLPGTYQPFTLDGRALTLESTDGAGRTVVDGGGTTRCAWLGTYSESTLRGFTLSQGYTPLEGGGVWGGTLLDCVLLDNTAEECGGGAYLARLERCVVQGNSAVNGSGGGAMGCDLANCLVLRNKAVSGGGIWSDGHFVANCTVVDNRAEETGGGIMSAGYVTNSIVWGNSAPESPEMWGCDSYYTCSPDADGGWGNIDEDPLFADPAAGDFRLREGSPCLDAGSDEDAVGDKDVSGNARIAGQAVDMGAYEKEAPAQTVWRFYSKAYKGHFFTISEAEKEDLIAHNPNWKFEGGAYRAYTNEGAGTVALHRFYSKGYKGHFFTIDAEEAEEVKKNRNWKYEGIAYYVYPEEVAGTVPVYRFWSKGYRHHFYTTSKTEKEDLEANNPNWKYEGIAFWALPMAATGAKATAFNLMELDGAEKVVEFGQLSGGEAGDGGGAETATRAGRPRPRVSRAGRPWPGTGRAGSCGVAVTTSDGTDGSAVADGDEGTGWSPAEAGAGWVALSFAEEREISGVEVVGENLPEGLRALWSEDAEAWAEEGTLDMARYVWVAFPDGGEVPTIREISVAP